MAARGDNAQIRPDFRDKAVRADYVQKLRQESDRRKAKALEWAKKHGETVRYDDGKSLIELVSFEDGRPMYYKTDNANAAISTAADLVRNTAPYDANGDGFVVGIWDGGSVLYTHQEFDGRVSVMDGALSHYHSTHVGGTVGASGVVVSAMGMAPSVNIDSYDWNSDTTEMGSRAMSYPAEPGTIQVSSHSYGFISGWYNNVSPPRWHGQWGYRESDNFGQYDDNAAEWDQICYDFPYFLPFKSSGNDRNDDAPAEGATFQYYDGLSWVSKSYDSSTDPCDDGWDDGGFDTIGLVGNAKNIVTVGAVYDAVSGGVRDISQAAMASFSSWGPTDDGRIKPDIVANGTSLYSTDNGSNSDYTTLSGTSMSTPDASGSAMLLIDIYDRQHPGQAMRSSTLKGLILHTADDLGNPGPDYSYGWGLMNTQAAADVIMLNSIKEGLLTETANPNDVYELQYPGAGPIRVTLCWTDPPADAVGTLDNPSPRLINDLDLRVAGPNGIETYYPFILDANNPSTPATTGDNVVDNVEQIYIAAPDGPGTYTAEVSYKGKLTDDQQYYSLIVSVPFPVIPEPPVASDSNVSTGPGVPLSIELVGNDDGLPDSPGALEYIIESLPQFGDINDPCTGLIEEVPYTLADNGNEVIYTSVDCYTGLDEFEFKVNDGGAEPNGGDSNIALVSIEVTAGPIVIFQTGFEQGLPAGWTVVDGFSDGETWMSENPANRTSPAGMWTGKFMLADSDWAGHVDMNELLVTRTFDFSNLSNVKLKFNHYFRYYSWSEDEIGDVDIRVDFGSWQNIARYEGASFEGPVELDISSIADDRANVQFRWHYYDANWDWYWGIDDVEIEGETAFEGIVVGDFEPDCDVDFADFGMFASAWLSVEGDGNWDWIYDISEPNDGIIDFIDFSIFTDNWLVGK